MLLALLRRAFLVLAVAAGCGDDPKPALSALLTPKPACTDVAPSYGAPGDTAYIVTDLSIATSPADGFDFNGDGRPDNVLSGIGVISKSAIRNAFSRGEVIVPIEFGPLANLTQQACVKFAFYTGHFPVDGDGDGFAAGAPGRDKGTPGGDCNELDAAIHPGAAEVPGDRVDNDCDGLADETPGSGGGPDGGADVPSSDTRDMDGDGFSLAQGDCDDRPGVGAMSHPGMAEICGDGLDNDCNGVADDGCDPYDGSGHQLVVADPASLQADRKTPALVFDNGFISAQPIGGVAAPVLEAGPSEWTLAIPTLGGVTFQLHLTAAHVRAHVTQDAMGRMVLPDALLGGVLDARTLGETKGLEIPEAGVHPQESLLDVVFAGALGDLLGLRSDAKGHKLPDIDVDGDGLETFWDSRGEGQAVPMVDTCKDGDGTIITNAMAGGPCVLAKDARGRYRFVDGLSVAIRFAIVPVRLAPLR
jgi:hypothetical protein